MRCSMQDVFAAHLDSFAAARSLHPRESRAAWCIRNCYSTGCGSHTLRCPEGHFSTEQFHACRHRSCPRCAARSRAAWIDAELTRLLPCPHFHVVFTLPHELLPLWEFNRACLIGVFFDCVRNTVLELLADPRHLGATPGLLLSLHTWGRNLSHHPHIHALVSAGGLTPAGQWRSTRAGYLLPLKPLQRLFCGKLLAALRALLDSASLHLPPRQPLSHWLQLLRALYGKHWNIQINPAYASGRSVTLYLARYARGGPLPQQRPLLLNHLTVSLDFTDHRDSRTKRLHLHVHEFIARILWHAPPKGVHTVRHAGLYAAAASRHHLQACIALSLPTPSPASAPYRPSSTHSTTDAVPHPTTPTAPACPACGSLLQLSFAPRSLRRNEISLLQSLTPPNTPLPTSSHLGPTPSFKPTSNGEPPGPGHRYPVHFLRPGPGVSPSDAA